MTQPYPENDLRALTNLEDKKYAGEKDKYDIQESLETHRSLVGAVNDSFEEFMRNAKTEMERLMDQLEKARNEMNQDSTTLLAILKSIPEGTGRKDAEGIRKWAKPTPQEQHGGEGS